MSQQFCYPIRDGLDEVVCVTLGPRAMRWATFGNAQKNFAYACFLVPDKTRYTVELLTRTRLTSESNFVVAPINDPTEAARFVHLREFRFVVVTLSCRAGRENRAQAHHQRKRTRDNLMSGVVKTEMI